MKTDKTKKEALAHYDRMIRWAKKQPQRKIPSPIDMKMAINKSWYPDYCPYCKKYRGECDICPLSTSFLSIYSACCNLLWDKMSKAHTWKGWITWATKVRAYIKKHG